MNKELKRLAMDPNLDDLTAVYRHANSNTNLFDYDPSSITRFIRRFVYTYPEPITEKLESIAEDSEPICSNNADEKAL